MMWNTIVDIVLAISIILLAISSIIHSKQIKSFESRVQVIEQLVPISFKEFRNQGRVLK